MAVVLFCFSFSKKCFFSYNFQEKISGINDDAPEKEIYKQALTEWTTYYFDFETCICEDGELKVDLAVCQNEGSEPRVFAGFDAVDQMITFFLEQ